MKKELETAKGLVRQAQMEYDILLMADRLLKKERGISIADLYAHDFHSDQPYRKMVTDITEFPLCDGRVCLSPMIGLHGGFPVNWKIGTSPNKDMAAAMLDEFKKIAPENAKYIIHTDRGWHYRVSDWIGRMKEYGFTRSMSRKGCSADNSACEGFFGILKREFFYNRNWKGVRRADFVKRLNDFLIWFKNDKIKTRLGFKSPADYRKMAS